MKRLFTIATILLIFPSIVFSQDQKAKSILDELSKNTKQYNSIKAEFKYSLENNSDGMTDSQDGMIITKGEKYFLSLGGQEVMSDGKSMWTHLTDVQEVQVNSVPEDSEENSDYINPNNIFTLYEKGFKYKYGGKETVNGESTDLIKLFPKKPGEKSYHSVHLFIDKDRKQIRKITIMGKEETDFTYTITSFTPNYEVSDSKFEFDKSKHPDVEIIDMRE